MENHNKFKQKKDKNNYHNNVKLLQDKQQFVSDLLIQVLTAVHCTIRCRNLSKQPEKLMAAINLLPISMTHVRKQLTVPQLLQLLLSSHNDRQNNMCVCRVCVFSAVLDYDAKFCVPAAPTALFSPLPCCLGDGGDGGGGSRRRRLLQQQPDMILCVNDGCVYADI